jgi:hypothetical protein
MEDLVREARKEYLAGKTSGPFTTAKDLMNHLSS